jgi:hypothetical protein
MSSELDAGKAERKGSNRRSFLQTSGGIATGIAVTILPSGVVALAAPSAAGAKAEPLGELVHPSGDVPDEPVMAYVHDAKKGVVTVVSGTEEKTYSDPALAKRLIDAARPRTV